MFGKALGRKPKLAEPTSTGGSFSADRARAVLLSNPIIGNDQAIAAQIFESSQLVSYKKGQNLIVQGGNENSVLFLLVGEVDIFVNDDCIGQRSAPDSVGEMAALRAQRQRSATVRAKSDELIALLISGDDVARLASSDEGFCRRANDVIEQRMRPYLDGHRPKPKKSQWFWTLLSFGIALVIGLVAFATLPSLHVIGIARIVLSTIVGLVGFLLVVLLNPVYFYRRMAATAVANLMITLIGIPSVEFNATVNDTTTAGVMIQSDLNGVISMFGATIVWFGVFLVSVLIDRSNNQ
ncbi:cyclic nucleotide-binding domain-containing protein [Parvularcula marina]|uniref:cyclic nucleotide-binding domain-containing protein n=1 Tax=Parvularcula marina TaxID=2292771 RepID=UPI003515DBE6